tara:strand:+ start:1262 stop:1651 length:390 start_codon:yes stop_codon:yes gene_type:complete
MKEIKITPRDLKRGMILHLEENFYLVKGVNRIGNTSYCSHLINEEGEIIREFFLYDDEITCLDESYLQTSRLDKEERTERDRIVKGLGINAGFQRYPDKFKKKLAQFIMGVKDLYTKPESKMENENENL